MAPDNDKTRTFVPLTASMMVSHYRIIEKIGAGGMGEVYLAEDTKLHRKVALKFLPLHLCQDPDCRARFTREAEAAAQLDHPNIVAVHEVGEFQGRPFFSMQHVEGQSLKEVIAGNGLALDRVVEIGILTEMQWQELERDFAVKLRVLRQVHLTHPTGADLLDDPVV